MVRGCEQEVHIGVEDYAGDRQDSDMNELEGMTVVEETIGGYKCPTSILIEAEKNRICRPWKCCVIVKLLRRKIGYKALESRLKQMWVRKGVINIIDIGNDYFLLTFSHEDDKRVP